MLVVTLPVNYLLQTKVLAANAIIEGVDLSFLSFIPVSYTHLETVALKEELRFGEEIDATVEHEGDGHGHYGAQLRGVAGVHTEGH